MGIKILRQRHRTAPAMNGCRWCGFLEIDHANRWVPGKGWHQHVQPTDAQRKSRLQAGSADTVPARLRSPKIVTNLASDGRTQL